MAAFTTIDDSGLFFNPTLYTGTGSSNAVTGVGFSADLTWLKSRNSTYSNYWFDTARGATKAVWSDNSDVEATNAEYQKSWESDGFTVGTNSGVNNSATTYASWNWKAGTTSGLSGGTITPSAYSFSTTSGFGVYAYAGNGVVGAEVPHGLGAVPKMIIIKGLDYAYDWQVYHVAGGNTGNMILNSTAQFATDNSRWDDTTPTSTVWTMGSGSTVNYSGRNFVAYVFAEIPGFSKFGSYLGNGNVDGPFLYTGFSPAFLLIKIYSGSGTGKWIVVDNKRNGFNIDTPFLAPNSSAAEDASPTLDLLSNGFKLRSTEFPTNADGKSILYAAFAESPFVNSSGVPTNAR